jgi:hypothetical protein
MKTTHITQDYDYINRYYGLTVTTSTKVNYKGEPHTVVGADGAYVVLRSDDGERLLGRVHPTWEMQYNQETTPCD